MPTPLPEPPQMGPSLAPVTPVPVVIVPQQPHDLLDWFQLNSAAIGVLVSLVAVGIAVWLGISANRLSSQAARIAERDERSRFGQMVIDYFSDRRTDVANGHNWNMPHYAEQIRGAMASYPYANAAELFEWLTDAIDRLYKYEDADRRMNVHGLRMDLPAIVSRWVRDPESFDTSPYVPWTAQMDSRNPAESADKP